MRRAITRLRLSWLLIELGHKNLVRVMETGFIFRVDMIKIIVTVYNSLLFVMFVFLTGCVIAVIENEIKIKKFSSYKS